MTKVKKLFCLAVLLIPANILLAAANYSGSISEYRRFSIGYLLTADDPSRIKMGAQWLDRDGLFNIELDDIAAKALWEFSQGTRKLDADTVAWLARALGSTQSQRYLPLLEKVARDNPGKIQNYANNSIAKLVNTGAPFESDNVRREQIRSILLQNQTKGNLPNEQSLFDLQIGAWIEEVFEKFGFPTDINVVSRSRRVPFVGRIYVDNLLLIYGDKGVVEFDHDRGDWYATRISPRLASSRTAINEDEITPGLLTQNIAAFRHAARNAYKIGVSDEPTLDVAAWRLRSDMKTSDGGIADGLAYLCGVIGNARNPRYRDLIAEVSKNAAESKVRKHAAAAFKKLPDVQAEQFIGQSPPNLDKRQ